MSASTTPPIRVLIVDDHAVVRDGLVAILGSLTDLLVAEAEGGREALALCEAHPPDVVLLDVRMPDLDGLQTLQLLRARFPRVLVLMLSSHLDDEIVHRALKEGAAGYLLKKMSAREVADAVRTVFRTRRLPVPPEVASRLAARLATRPLADRELQVLRLIGQGQSNKEIAASLGLSANTVRNYINNLMEKLGASDRTHAVTLALQRGLIDLDFGA